MELLRSISEDIGNNKMGQHLYFPFKINANNMNTDINQGEQAYEKYIPKTNNSVVWAKDVNVSGRSRTVR